MNEHDDGQQHEQADDVVWGAGQQMQQVKLISLRGASRGGGGSISTDVPGCP
jgi:hypothetical protein